MDFCLWLGASTPQEYAQCEEKLEWFTNPIEKALEALNDSVEPYPFRLEDYLPFRVPSFWSDFTLPRPKKSAEDKLRDGVQSLLDIGRFILSAPPVRIPFEMGLSSLDTMKRGLEYLGIDFSLENLMRQRELRVERLKNLPLERLTFLQEDLNEKIQKGLQNSKNGDWVKDLSIVLEDGVMYLKGRVDLGLTDVDLKGEITFEVKDGRSEGRVVKLEAGGFSLPDMIKEKIVAILKQYGVRVPRKPDFEDLSWLEMEGLQNLSIQNGQVVIDMIKG